MGDREWCGCLRVSRDGTAPSGRERTTAVADLSFAARLRGRCDGCRLFHNTVVLHRRNLPRTTLHARRGRLRRPDTRPCVRRAWNQIGHHHMRDQSVVFSGAVCCTNLHARHHGLYGRSHPQGLQHRRSWHHHHALHSALSFPSSLEIRYVVRRLR
jgi:hypothetical protein